jgi:hypothetical protein
MDIRRGWIFLGCLIPDDFETHSSLLTFQLYGFFPPFGAVRSSIQITVLPSLE